MALGCSNWHCQENFLTRRANNQRRSTMALAPASPPETNPVSTPPQAATNVAAPALAAKPQPAPQQTAPKWRNYAAPGVVLLLAIAIVVTVTRNWNAWEGDRIEQVTDDAYVRGDLTPLSTKVAGIVKDVNVSDFQQVHKGDLLVELQDDDFKAQVAQANAAVEAARAAIENNVRQQQLQESRIQRASAGIDQAKAQIAAAQAGREAVQADLVRTRAERNRQEALLQTHSIRGSGSIGGAQECLLPWSQAEYFFCSALSCAAYAVLILWWTCHICASGTRLSSLAYSLVSDSFF
jgi:multidrug efflux pump subunit AcrA (membrane-fusion protein)